MKFHKSYAKEIDMTIKIKSYIQSIVLKKTLGSISFSYRRDSEETLEEVVLLKELRDTIEVKGSFKIKMLE